MRLYLLLLLLLLPLNIFAKVYYAEFKDSGEVSEAGTDIVLYYNNGNVWGYLRVYTNMTDNIYADLYGKGNPDDLRLTLYNVNYSEGEVYDGGETSLEFTGADRQTLVVNGHALSKYEQVIPGMKWLGDMPSKEQIVATVNKFINKDAALAKSLLSQLPQSDIGNTRQIKLTNVTSTSMNPYLEELFAVASRQSDSTLLNRFKADPAFAVVYGLKKMGKISETKQEYAYEDEKGKVGYTLKTCDANFNVEDDEDGQCKTYDIYHQKHLDVPLILVEVAIHETCLDDSCSHEYHRLYLMQGDSFGWKVSSHTQGMRCESYRGGGSPPCL